MIISERQIFDLINIATDYRNKLWIMIDKDIVEGDAQQLYDSLGNFLSKITNQQSEELKVIE
jgi:hypothetical protein